MKGAPRVGFTRGGLYPNRGNRSRQQIKSENNKIKSPTRKRRRVGHPIHPFT
jgi:hypothetical protein